MRRQDILGSILGILVLLSGIGLLIFVFVLAYSFFNSPAGQLATSKLGADISATTSLGHSAINLLVRIALLIVMMIIGSLLAGRGAQLYFASLEPDRAIRERRDRNEGTTAEE